MVTLRALYIRLWLNRVVLMIAMMDKEKATREGGPLVILTEKNDVKKRMIKKQITFTDLIGLPY